MFLTQSKDGIPIRLTHERVEHIVRNHLEMTGQEGKVLETVSEPDYVQQGDHATKVAVRLYPQTPLTRKFMIVVYRELLNDGFVITAYFASQMAQWRKILWRH